MFNHLYPKNQRMFVNTVIKPAIIATMCCESLIPSYTDSFVLLASSKGAADKCLVDFDATMH